MPDGDIICDPTQKQMDKSSARMTIVFSNRQSADSTSPSIVSCYTEGRVSPDMLQQCVSAGHLASQEIFKFYRSSMARKFSKEIDS